MGWLGSAAGSRDAGAGGPGSPSGGRPAHNRREGHHARFGHAGVPAAGGVPPTEESANQGQHCAVPLAESAEVASDGTGTGVGGSCRDPAAQASPEGAGAVADVCERLGGADSTKRSPRSKQSSRRGCEITRRSGRRTSTGASMRSMMHLKGAERPTPVLLSAGRSARSSRSCAWRASRTSTTS